MRSIKLLYEGCYMGNKDIATKKYMSDNVRFADVFNYAIYGGRQIIKHDMLKEISAEELLLMEGDKEKLSVKECRCSTLQKLWENQHHYVYINCSKYSKCSGKLYWCIFAITPVIMNFYALEDKVI